MIEGIFLVDFPIVFRGRGGCENPKSSLEHNQQSVLGTVRAFVGCISETRRAIRAPCDGSIFQELGADNLRWMGIMCVRALVDSCW